MSHLDDNAWNDAPDGPTLREAEADADEPRDTIETMPEIDSAGGFPIEWTATAILPESLIPCDVCGQPATVGFSSDEMACASDYPGPSSLCDEHGSVGEEGGEELEQAACARSLTTAHEEPS